MDGRCVYRFWGALLDLDLDCYLVHHSLGMRDKCIYGGERYLYRLKNCMFGVYRVTTATPRLQHLLDGSDNLVLFI